MALINSVTMLFLMPIFGINQGVQPIIGYNYGAKKYKRVKEALKYSVAGAAIINAISFAFIELFPRQIMSIFIDGDIRLLELSSKGLVMFLMALPVVGVAMVITNYFQAIAKAKISIRLSLLRQVILLIPLILIMSRLFKLEGVWMAQPISDLLSALITTVFIVIELKNLGRLENVGSVDSNIEIVS